MFEVGCWPLAEVEVPAVEDEPPAVVAADDDEEDVGEVTGLLVLLLDGDCCRPPPVGLEVFVEPPAPLANLAAADGEEPPAVWHDTGCWPGSIFDPICS